jgi:hypothetical protein
MDQSVVNDIVSKVVTDATVSLEADSTVQKVVADVVTGNVKDVVTDAKNLDVAVISKEVVASAVATVETAVNGKDVSCSCCGWQWTLKISRGTTLSSQPTPAASS